jgi:hypothetical protein
MAPVGSSMRRSIVIGPPCFAIEANAADPPNRYPPYERSACFPNPSSLKMWCDTELIAAVTADVFLLAAPICRQAATSSCPMPRRVDGHPLITALRSPSLSRSSTSPPPGPGGEQDVLPSLGSLDGGGAGPARRRGQRSPAATRVHHGPQRSAIQAQYSEPAVLHVARNRHSTRKPTRNVTQIDDRTGVAPDAKRGGTPVIARVPPLSLHDAEGIRTLGRQPFWEDGSVSREAATQARLRQ